MKIRNKHNGAEIISTDLTDNGHLFTLSIISDKQYYGVHCFYKDDGWEKIKDLNEEDEEEDGLNHLRKVISEWDKKVWRI